MARILALLERLTRLIRRSSLTFLDNDYLPIIAPIGIDDNFDTYNINADDAACAIAKAVGADKLAFLTDIEGVYTRI